MKGHEKGRNILVYIAMIFFLLLLLILSYTLQNKSISIERKLQIQIDYKTEKGILKSWFDEKEDAYYFFLPAETKKIKIKDKDNHWEIIGLEDEQVIDVDAIEMQKKYDAIIKEKGSRKIQVVFMKSKNIPAMFINTNSGDLEYINERKGNSEKGEYSIVSSEHQENVSGEISGISGRGNTSWTDCEKKGYKIQLTEERALLGLRPSQKYNLIANARSNYLSNSIAFWMEKEIGIKNVPEERFIDLYFNGEYAGNYIICEPIEVDEEGINITDLDVKNAEMNPGVSPKELVDYKNKDETIKCTLWKNSPQEIGGGYLLERDVPEYYAGEKSGFVLPSGDHYVLKSPRYASVNETEYIRDYMLELYQAVEDSEGYNDLGKHYTEYIDIDSFALKYVLEEFLAFNDAGRSSAYYYKDTNDVLRAGPGWDFEGAFLGNVQYITELNGTPYSTALYEKLLQHKEFYAYTTEIYEVKLKPTIDKVLSSKIEEMEELILDSATMDTVRWKREDFQESCDEIKEWIQARVNVLDKHWLSEEKLITIKIENEWENNQYIYLHSGDKITDSMMPKLVREGYELAGWNYGDSGEMFTFPESIYRDITLKPIWNKKDSSKIQTIVYYVNQVVPELCFGILVLIVGFVYLIKIRFGGIKK